jgi:regulator of replication initiation timing
MKNTTVLMLFFSLCCCATGIPSAAAAEGGGSSHLSTGKVLEFSLSSLKESLEKILQKNERLAFENEMLRKSIYDLAQEKEYLTEKKAGLSGRLPISGLEHKKLQSLRIADRLAREQRTRELISLFQRDIVRLREEVRVLEDSLNAGEFNARRKMLLDKAQKSGKDLVQAEKKFNSMQQKNKAPANKVKALQKEQNDLVREIQGLQYQLRGF